MHQEESTAELLAKLVDLKKTNPERYDEIMAIIDSYDETGEGAHMPASELKSLMPEELAENIKLIVRETYEAACMECGYEEGLEEETEAVEEYLAEAKKNWIKGALHKSRKGEFTAAAKKAGMSVAQYAKHVLAHTEDFDKKRIGQANFALRAQKGFKKKKEE